MARKPHFSASVIGGVGPMHPPPGAARGGLSDGRREPAMPRIARMGKNRRPGDDTTMGGARGAFPNTPGSAILGVRTDDEVARGRAFSALVRAYWKPAYKHLRLRWRKPNDVAKDLTQAFFARAFEKRVFETYDPDKARFRTFIKRCLDNFVASANEADARQKRGGGAIKLSLDFDEVDEGLLVADPAVSTEDQFDREWVRGLHGMGVDALREELYARDKAIYFELFRRYDLDGLDPRPTYGELAEEHGIKVTDVTNYLSATRRRFREIILDKLRELTASEEEFRAEALEVLGVDPAAVTVT
jgi:DNA-directed RNA polymerase specialized sigma24 family protein